jgi:hypothetical protein
MSRLRDVAEKFATFFTIIAGGSGLVRGALSPANLNEQPAYLFITPRHVFKTPFPTALKPGMVLRSNGGEVFIVGENGPSDTFKGMLWQSFRLFEATGQYEWARGKEYQDQITHLKTKGKPEVIDTIWAALESLDREVADREMRVNFEQRRVITGSPIKVGDTVDNHTVSKVDKQLGLWIGVLT